MIRAAVLAVVLLAALPAGAEPITPAELPPADYAGQQYVDSRGCMFVRAGTGGKVVWVPRVSREGVPICDNPPSGKRVPVVEEVGVQPVPAAGSTATAGAGGTDAGTGGYYVAVGSFGMAGNADRAEAKLVALNYDVVKGRVQGATTSLVTVFAGPFADEAAARAARDALRGEGFPEAMVVGP